MATASDITFAQLKTLYEVSRQVNSQLDLQKLLDGIMDSAVDLLHAEKGLIFLSDQGTGELSLQVARALDKQSIQNIVKMSRSIIHQVGREARPRLLRNTSSTPPADLSESILRNKITSIVCVPLHVRNRLIGVIYLDTTTADRFFKDEDIPFLEAFANLAAIAIDNARSYHEIKKLNTSLEAIVQERTREVRLKHDELNKAYRELQNTQVQLIRSEKMASLGLLVAGIAHEINSPVGSIGSNADVISRSVEKLRQTLDSMDSSSSEASATTIIKLLRVLGQVSETNNAACERIAGIVKALRNFARLDEGDFKVVDIHEGIDSTLRLIRREHEGRIEIIQEYGDIPKVYCRAGQLNQVFLNLLLNACQAIHGKGTIRIRTHSDSEVIHLEIVDSGVGIPPENLPKIYDPGFTTKGVGVGMGLGLSICYQILKDHGSSIDVESEVGRGTKVSVILARGYVRMVDQIMSKAVNQRE